MSLPAAPSPAAQHPRPLRELAGLFLRLGATAFGGPAAHIAMMEDEVVARRGWLTREEFIDLVAASNLIPGPNSTELAIHIGHRRAGAAGLIVAGVCFILPATFIVALIAWAYLRLGALPQLAGVLFGVKPVVIAIVIQALWRLGAACLRTRLLIFVALGALGCVLAGVHELIVLFGAALLVLFARVPLNPKPKPPALHQLALPAALAAGSGAAAAAVPFSLSGLFLFFLKVGSVLFGSGYVLLAFLRADLVERWGWLTEAQLLDAIAVGQVTPGPVFTTATFIGYILGGPAAAALATLGIFLPAFVFVALSAPLLPRLRRSPGAAAALDGLNAASLALMAAVLIPLGQTVLTQPLAIAILLVSLALLFRTRLNASWLMLGGALLGLLASA